MATVYNLLTYFRPSCEICSMGAGICSAACFVEQAFIINHNIVQCFLYELESIDSAREQCLMRLSLYKNDFSKMRRIENLKFLLNQLKEYELYGMMIDDVIAETGGDYTLWSQNIPPPDIKDSIGAPISAPNKKDIPDIPDILEKRTNTPDLKDQEYIRHIPAQRIPPIRAAESFARNFIMQLR